MTFTNSRRQYIKHLRNLFDPWTNQKINIIKTTGVRNFQTLGAFTIFGDFYTFFPKNTEVDPKSKALKKKKKVAVKYCKIINTINC